MHKAVASESWAAQDPHTYADLKQSPRYPEAIRTPANTAEMVSRGAGLHPHSSAWHTQNGAEYSRKTVAESDATQSQTFRRALSTLLAIAIMVHPAPASAKCRTHRCFQRVHQHRVQDWLKQHRPWIYAWRHLSEWERNWARCIANHETRGIPWSRKAYVATGNGYYGSTQWLPSTWHSAGGSGLPTEHSLHEQLVRTVRWAHAAGSSQWSTSRTCGSV